MRMWHGDGPLVPPSDLEFLYSPSAAQVALMCTPCRRQSHKRVSRNHMAYPKGTNPGHIIYQKKKQSDFCRKMDDFYVRYYVGHKGKFGHEFMEFEFRPDGRLRYANNSNYKNDVMIRKEGEAA